MSRYRLDRKQDPTFKYLYAMNGMHVAYIFAIVNKLMKEHLPPEVAANRMEKYEEYYWKYVYQKTKGS